MISMVKLIKKQVLKEDWGNLISVSPFIRQQIQRNYSFRPLLGKDSIVKVVKSTPQEIYALLDTYSYNPQPSISPEEKLLGVNVRYGQTDLFFIMNEPDYRNSFSIEESPELDYMNKNVIDGEKFKPQDTFKTESGFVKIFNSVVLWLSRLSSYNPEEFDDMPNKKSDILQKMNFQLIYGDSNKIDTNNERRLLRWEGDNAVVNNISTPSNKVFNDKSLKLRLKKYLENKLPHYQDVTQIPKDIKNFKTNYQFKLFGCVYKMNDSYLNGIIEGKDGYIDFRNQNRDEKIYKNYPSFIVFKVALNDEYQLYVKDIYVYNGINYTWQQDRLEPIDNFQKVVKELSDDE